MFIKCLKINKTIIFIFFIILVILICSIFLFFSLAKDNETSDEKKDYIKWVDFNVTCEAMKLTSKLDIESHNSNSEIKYNWIELLAYFAAQNGGNFKNFKKSDLDYLVSRLDNGETVDDLTSDMKFYDYYYEAYSAVLSGFIGNYSVETTVSDTNDNLRL